MFIHIYVFWLFTASELELPDMQSDSNLEEVDAEMFWQQVNLGILYRGILRGNQWLTFFETLITALFTLNVILICVLFNCIIIVP